MTDTSIQTRPVEALIPYARNSRTHSDAQVAQIAASLDEFGMVGAIVVRDSVIAKGHGTLSAIRKLYAAGKRLYPAPGAKQGAEPYPDGTAPVLDVSGWTDAQFRAYVIADNKLAENAGWDKDLLALELGDLVDLDGALQTEREPSPTLADRFGIAPFSVLDARRGWWMERKRSWLSSGITTEAGRGDMLTFSLSAQPPHAYEAKNRYEAAVGHAVSWEEFAKAHPEAIVGGGTSVFDPALFEAEAVE